MYVSRRSIILEPNEALNLRDRVLRKLATSLDPSIAGESAPGQYQFDPHGYMTNVLGWNPWRGNGDAEPGQSEILDAYKLALLQQNERSLYQDELLGFDQLQYWQPGIVIQNWIRVEAGHTTGKTFCVAGIACHFFDSFDPSITYAFAPTYPQINDLLFKYIREHRQKNNLPGQLLQRPELKLSHNHYVKGKATQGGQTEAVQGQHEEYMLFIVDEAEGIEDYVWDAIESMSGGGKIVVVIAIANPRTRTSGFYKLAARDFTKSLRMSCLNHPNVLAGRDIVPNAVRRDYVLAMINTHCQIIDAPEPDNHTFTVEWDDHIYLPNNEFLFRIMGIPPSQSSADTFSPVGRYETAEKRDRLQYDEEFSKLLPIEDRDDIPDTAYFGIDCARYGDDAGTIYLRIGDNIERVARIAKQDGYAYYIALRELCYALPDYILNVEIRVDGGGGYGSTVIDNISRELELHERFENFDVYEVMFNALPYDARNFADKVTEMYYHAGEALHVLALWQPPNALKADVTERQYRFVKIKGRDVKRLVSKDDYRRKHRRSPDDGDGFVLAVSPSHLFAKLVSVGFA